MSKLVNKILKLFDKEGDTAFAASLGVLIKENYAKEFTKEDFANQAISKVFLQARPTQALKVERRAIGMVLVCPESMEKLDSMPVSCFTDRKMEFAFKLSGGNFLTA